jgi:hypothetical protein
MYHCLQDMHHSSAQQATAGAMQLQAAEDNMHC